jgi:RNA polymerase sigma factor (sigma-70 family)
MDSAQALIRLSQALDGPAWEALLELHGAEMLRLCRRILGPDCAEDAVQEALLSIRDHARLFNGGGDHPAIAARAWIMRVTTNTALGMLRKQRRGSRHESTYAKDSVPAPARDATSDNENLEAVHRELAHMTDDERLPVVLHFLGGMDYQELSAALNCPLGTAKTRVHYGVRKLRERLAALGILFTTEQLSETLSCPPPEPAGGQAPPGPQRETWRKLLESPRKPLSHPFASEPIESVPNRRGGLSTMAKVSIVAAVLVLAATTFTVYKSQSADTSSPAERSTANVAHTPSLPDRNPKPIGEDATEKAQPVAPATADEMAAAVRGLNEFSFDFYAKLKGEKGNLFVSPYSISTALGMTYAGARGNTAAEMEKSMHYTLGARLHNAYGQMILDLNATEKNGKPRGFQLSVANRLFGQKNYPFLQEFLDRTRNSYGAELEACDFSPRQPAEASRQHINGWVADKTQQKIKELIPGGAVDGAALVLVNAIYFKGDWAEQFDKAATADAAFHLSATEQAPVPLMHKQFDVKYMEKEGSFQAIELPYKNKELSMVVFLPAKVDGWPNWRIRSRPTI